MNHPGRFFAPPGKNTNKRKELNNMEKITAEREAETMAETTAETPAEMGRDNGRDNGRGGAA